jgi:molecular chaperone DnaK (HSP70)
MFRFSGCTTIFEVLATSGDTQLGGDDDDIDNLLLQIALEDVTAEWGSGSERWCWQPILGAD